MLTEKLAMREKETEELKKSIVRQEADMSAKHAADTQVAAERAAKELEATVELHQQKVSALQARYGLSACYSGDDSMSLLSSIVSDMRCFDPLG